MEDQDEDEEEGYGDEMDDGINVDEDEAEDIEQQIVNITSKKNKDENDAILVINNQGDKGDNRPQTNQIGKRQAMTGQGKRPAANLNDNPRYQYGAQLPQGVNQRDFQQYQQEIAQQNNFMTDEQQ